MPEVDQFFQDLGDDQKQQVDILDQPLNPTGQQEEPVQTGATGPQGEEDEDNDEYKPKNRRERRLMKKLQEERESAIALAAKLEAQTDARRHITDEEADYLKGIERIYGTETPEAQMATELLKKAISGARTDAEVAALEKFRAEVAEQQQQEREAEAELDGFIEEIEDEHNVSLNADQQKGYFELLYKMSPKDKEGNVIDYADPHAVWELYQERLNSRKTSNPAKQLASRSLKQGGGQGGGSKLQDDTQVRFLRDNGII